MAAATRRWSLLSAGITLVALIPAILLLLCSRSLAGNTLTQGGPGLNSSTVLVSPNGLFSLGFRRIPAGESNGSSYLGIGYNNDTKFIFWIANPDSPIPSGSSGELALDGNGTLKLTHSGGRGAVVLYSSNSRRERRLSAVLEDTGCFSLLDADGNPLWQSFDSPADFWLQGMKLGAVNGGGNRKLTSWLKNSVPAPGAFTLEWDPTAGKEELVMKRLSPSSMDLLNSSIKA
ncbi:unnamed protein product [Linum tenue]|uniref:Bulb-type lectin domain-containing protein n=1 Tax=Linum tenue TaxID=586396 RepID=A0AAV0NG04_9ROSI|nr:unnamed protein product [Linum tenue]